MFNRLPGAMLPSGHTHQWAKGRNCSRVLSQHTASACSTVTACSIRRGRRRSYHPPNQLANYSGIAAKNQIGLVKQQFGTEMTWQIVDRNPKNRRAEGNRRSHAEIKCERRTAA